MHDRSRCQGVRFRNSDEPIWTVGTPWGTCRPVASFDLPVSLRKSLGDGEALAEEAIVEALTPFDEDGDGALDRKQLGEFFKDREIAGPWVCEVLAATVWRNMEGWWATEMQTISITAIASMIHLAMHQAPRPDERWVIEPYAALGLEPKKPLDKLARRAIEAGGFDALDLDAVIADEPEVDRAGPEAEGKPSGRARGRPRPRPTGRKRPAPKPKR